jgi:uncharacterized phage protein (TIGR02220 family)
LTYGVYGRKSARIETKELAALTDLPAWHIGKARSKLIERNIIDVSLGANQKIKTYRFNKYYKKWKDLAPRPIATPQANEHSPGANEHSPGAKPHLLKKESIKENSKETGGEKTPADPDPPKPKNPPPPYKRIIEYFNAMTGSNFKHENDATRAQIRARFKTGFTEQDFEDVIKVKTDQWLGNPRMLPYLRPGTLFRPSKFESYLQEAQRSKKIVKSERQRVKERRFKIAAGILEESGQEACLKYCQQQRLDGEEFKEWILKNTKA